jgi:hypothetical protein
MLLISAVSTTFMRTRPRPQLTFRLPPVGYANGFLIALFKNKNFGFSWGWVGLN